MERSFARLQTKTIDLMQVHNLVDAETQLQTMREWRAQGDSGISASRITKQAPAGGNPRARKLDSFRSTIRSWNAKPRKNFTAGARPGVA
jgi:aryl-alcohol dehydrogenase-like predicted oxidoreductase